MCINTQGHIRHTHTVVVYVIRKTIIIYSYCSFSLQHWITVIFFRFLFLFVLCLFFRIFFVLFFDGFYEWICIEFIWGGKLPSTFWIMTWNVKRIFLYILCVSVFVSSGFFSHSCMLLFLIVVAAVYWVIQIFYCSFLDMFLWFLPFRELKKNKNGSNSKRKEMNTQNTKKKKKHKPWKVNDKKVSVFCMGVLCPKTICFCNIIRLYATQ